MYRIYACIYYKKAGKYLYLDFGRISINIFPTNEICLKITYTTSIQVNIFFSIKIIFKYFEYLKEVFVVNCYV